MTSLSDDNQADIIKACTPASRYLDNLLKDTDSTAPKRGSVFIGLMIPDGPIWYR